MTEADIGVLQPEPRIQFNLQTFSAVYLHILIFPFTSEGIFLCIVWECLRLLRSLRHCTTRSFKIISSTNATMELYYCTLVGSSSQSELLIFGLTRVYLRPSSRSRSNITCTQSLCCHLLCPDWILSKLSKAYAMRGERFGDPTVPSLPQTTYVVPPKISSPSSSRVAERTNDAPQELQECGAVCGGGRLTNTMPYA